MNWPMSFDPEHPERGWQPAIPLPFYAWWWKQCECGQRFLREEKYREHWRTAHAQEHLEGGDVT